MKSIPELFRIQAGLVPQHPAVITGDGPLTYRELLHRVNAATICLNAAGLGPGRRAGVCLGRSQDLVVSLLAVQQTGACYVPMDPAYPANALQLMAEQAKLDLIIASPDGSQKLPTGLRAKTLAAESFRTVAQPVKGNTAGVSAGVLTGTGLAADDLIYVIFTSGSTGIPKGAGVYFRGFANLLDWFTQEFAIGPSDRTLLVSSPSFDLTQKNFYAPLVTGGTLILSEAAQYEPEAVRELIAKHKVTLLNCTPSAFYPLVECASDGELRQLNSLRCVFLGGEPIHTTRMRNWLDSPWFRAEIVNTFGPTECSDIVAYHRLTPLDLAGNVSIPIGKPVWNTVLEVIGDNHVPVRKGEPGELYVSGAGVGAGYVNDPALTAKRFLHHAQDVMYRTGDLVRERADGALEFLGRADHQVKVRGFRIELPEVESVCRMHPDIRDCVAIVKNDHLLLWYLSGSGQPVAEAELRRFAAETLPAFKVPSSFRLLDCLPLSPNGKVDRHALSTFQEDAPAGTKGRETTTAERVHSLWKTVLGRQLIGFEENFFDAGGTSLSAITLQHLLEAAFHRKIPVTAIFERPTIAGLAALLNQPESPAHLVSENVRAQRQADAFRSFRRAAAGASPGTSR